MTQFGDLYSRYYDLLYRDKDYEAEVQYVVALIKKYYPNAVKMLDLGCGTGKHAELFCHNNYLVHGVDLSDEMLSIAATRRKGKEDRLMFSRADISSLKLDKKFDVAVSLFHVMSYLNSNEDLLSTFKLISDHLEKGGLFIFDFWYGPAVLTERPATRVKTLEDEGIMLTRIAEPTCHAQSNIVDVRYNVFIKDKRTLAYAEKQEKHSMRYYFDTDLDLICERAGFEVLGKYKWLTDEPPSFNSWNVVWVVRT